MAEPNRRILLIDDDEHLLITLGDFLVFEGFEVRQARDAQTGLGLLESWRPALVLLDMRMPGMDGKEFLVRMAKPDGTTPCPVLVLTALTMTADALSPVQVAGVLSKPCELEEVVGRIRQALNIK
jgi:DNA-binding response OmpR family regulator